MKKRQFQAKYRDQVDALRALEQCLLTLKRLNFHGATADVEKAINKIQATLR